MNRQLGLTGVGTVLLAGALLYAPTKREARSNDVPVAKPALVQGQPSTDGPWVASCQYWSPTPTSTMGQGDASLGPRATGNVGSKSAAPQSGGNADAPAVSKEEQAPSHCGQDWGIPAPGSTEHVEIHALIATLPDPIHSHLALGFDRTTDAFMQAAADNRYLASQYWLPWRGRATPAASDTPSSESNERSDTKREEEPGLIIFKYGPRKNEQNASSTAYDHVLYCFLVGESPALGVNGGQLRRALAYESRLKTDFHAQLSMGRDNELAVIGPYFSGSAASLRAGLETAPFDDPPTSFLAVGETSTAIAKFELSGNRTGTRPIRYLSFAENTKFELDSFFSSLYQSTYDVRRVAVLEEDGTVFGDAGSEDSRRGGMQIRFPREISLLRNAEGKQISATSTESTAASPYLSATLRDSEGDDTFPHFSTTQTPLSQEAELMSVAKQLQSQRTQYVLIAASNILDEIFLAQFLHRACPDLRIIFYNGGDLLTAREGENQPYIGSIVISPYTLLTFDNAAKSARAFPDAHSERAYNAASYLFWSGTRKDKQEEAPALAGYQPVQLNGTLTQDRMIPLWATANGSDGFYPLGILSPCASDAASILPSFVRGLPRNCMQAPIQFSPKLSETSPNAAPALFWFVLSLLITCLCVAHTAVMLSAEYWSAFTRDLAVRQNDQPRRRSVYLNIGTCVLFCMSFVLSFPLFALLIPWFGSKRYYLVDTPSITMAAVTLFAGLIALFATLSRTLPHSGSVPGLSSESAIRLYPYFNLIALIGTVTIPALWIWICLRVTVHGTATFVGMFFSYRCLHPLSGVSPVIPVLLLLFSWYLWSIFQTARLRFSTMSRPRLPGVVPGYTYSFYVSDPAITGCGNPVDCCLIENVTCLLITRETIRRYTGWSAKKLNSMFFSIYLLLFALCIFCGHIHSLERFLLSPGHWPTAYEFLIAALFFPLVMVAVTGWMRMILIWGSLNRGLLEPLERTPLRVAFSRLREVGWIEMLSQSGLHIRWRDMARSTESMRQIVNSAEVAQAMGIDGYRQLTTTYDTLLQRIADLRKRIGQRAPVRPDLQPPDVPPGDDDLPEEDHVYDLGYIYSIEKLYAEFCEQLLAGMLLPYWSERRVGFVEDVKGSDAAVKKAGGSDDETADDPLHIQLAEELLAIRYVALIRSVLVNMRFLMLFVSAAFVITIIGWNSYPFQPHQLIDFCFTLLLLFLGGGFIWVFAQMHRSSILSRITDTKPNELGRDFYLRIISFGAVPVLTWLAYQFPGVGGSLFRLLQPGLQVIK